MFDFFDEDFPLSKKQEEEYRKRLAESEDEEASEKATTGVRDHIIFSDPELKLSDIVKEITDLDIVFPETDGVYEDYEEDEEELMMLQETEEPAAPEQPAAEEQSPCEEKPEETDESLPSETAEEPETISEDVVEVTADEVGKEIPVEAVKEESEEQPAENPAEQPADTNIAEKMASLDEIEAHLHEELKNLGEKLDNMERTVDGMEDGEIAEGFNYEYDEKYFAEDETPAYRHPELYKAKENRSKDLVVKKKAQPSKELTIDRNALIKAGAAIAAAAVAIKLLGGRENKK